MSRVGAKPCLRPRFGRRCTLNRGPARGGARGSRPGVGSQPAFGGGGGPSAGGKTDTPAARPPPRPGQTLEPPIVVGRDRIPPDLGTARPPGRGQAGNPPSPRFGPPVAALPPLVPGTTSEPPDSVHSRAAHSSWRLHLLHVRPSGRLPTYRSLSNAPLSSLDRIQRWAPRQVSPSDTAMSAYSGF